MIKLAKDARSSALCPAVLEDYKDTGAHWAFYKECFDDAQCYQKCLKAVFKKLEMNNNEYEYWTSR